MTGRSSWSELLSGLTGRGRSLLASGAVLTALGLVLGQRDVLRAGVFIVVLPLTALALVSRTRYLLTCTRSLDPARVPAGAPATVLLRIDNVSRLPSGVLLMEDALPPQLGGRPRFVLDRVEPRGVREVSYPVRSPVRGRFRVGPLSVRLTDPFGLCELSRSFPTSGSLTVTPAVSPLPAVRLGGNWAGGGDAATRALASSGTDDAATREYRYGDDLRRVHWRSTARVGELIVRREEQPFRNRATLLLDGRARAHHGDGAASSFEWAVGAVASIGVCLARSGFVLSVLRESGTPLTPPGASLDERVLLDELATTAPSRATSLDAVTEVLRRDGLGGVLVAVLGSLDGAEAERLARVRSGSQVCVAVLMETDSWAPVSGRGQTEAAARRDRAEALLVASGWRVLLVESGTALESVWPLAAGAAGRPVTTAGAPARPATAAS